jgi:hypothetical protein
MTDTFLKDPAARLDYTVDWTAWLGADTIAQVDWTVPAGLTTTATSNATTTATVWLSGGTLGATYEVVCQVTTATGRIDQRTIRIQVRDR